MSILINAVKDVPSHSLLKSKSSISQSGASNTFGHANSISKISKNALSNLNKGVEGCPPVNECSKIVTGIA